ncbi:hypothetical protein NDA01_30440 [Trichocoleus desertorum AS-A10]
MAWAQAQAPTEVAEHFERTHERRVHRRVSLYQELGDWAEQWQDVHRWLKVERWGCAMDKPLPTPTNIALHSCVRTLF